MSARRPKKWKPKIVSPSPEEDRREARRKLTGAWEGMSEYMTQIHGTPMLVVRATVKYPDGHQVIIEATRIERIEKDQPCLVMPPEGA